MRDSIQARVEQIVRVVTSVARFTELSTFTDLGLWLRGVSRLAWSRSIDSEAKRPERNSNEEEREREGMRGRAIEADRGQGPS